MSVYDWVKFSEGHWEKRVPTEPGLYYFRGAGRPTHYPTICVRRSKDRLVYLDASDTEIAPETLELFMFWSEPMPGLPDPGKEGR
jgi:hypothetical protein